MTPEFLDLSRFLQNFIVHRCGKIPSSLHQQDEDNVMRAQAENSFALLLRQCSSQHLFEHLVHQNVDGGTGMETVWSSLWEKQSKEPTVWPNIPSKTV